MFDTSKDVLFLVIALAVVILTFFTSWLLYYLVKILKKGYSAINQISEKIETLSSIVDTLKDKIEHSASAFTLLSKAINKLISSWQERRANKKGRGKTNQTEDTDDF
ncbi:hypothetical protein ACFL04_01925 [Patescibacteria group bacterium]